MKKIISLLLAVVLVLSLAACTPGTNDGTTGNNAASGNTTAATDGDTNAQMLVGYGKVDVTPQESVPLRGYGLTERRMSTGLKSYIYVIGIAVTDTEGNTAILISTDNCNTPEEVYKAASKGIEKELGIPAQNVIISAIHQHSCPDLNNDKVASAVRYKENVFIPALIEVAKQAMENRAPATMQVTTVETENMNFVRRYKATDGTYNGTEDYSKTYVDQETEVDNDLQLIKFIREGQTTQNGKKAKNIILANFQGHPLMGTSSSDTNVHSDVPGVFRDTLEAKLDCQSIYFTGASGNAEFISRFASENRTNKDYKEHGKLLAEYAIKAEDTYKDVELSTVKATMVTYTGDCDHSRDSEAVKAQEAYDYWVNAAKPDKKYLLSKYGYVSWLEPSAIVRKAKAGATRSFDIFTISFGDVAFIAAPYEMFDHTGMEIKSGSPFEMTFVATSANGGNGYMPAEYAYAHGGYEVFSTNMAPGSAEELRDEYLKMLNQLHG